MQQALSALVIHDIKNSLALLEADLEQLNHRADAPDEARKAYQRCIELKSRLISFLTLYKHEQGRLLPNLGEIDLAEFLEDMIAGSQSVTMASRHGHAIAVNVDEDRIRIATEVRHKGVASLDEYLVDLALESALNNAVRYAASRVDVWFEQDADRLTFFVFDDGPGPAHTGHAEAATTSAKPASTGLGLSLCKTVTEAHGGGKVTLADAPGGGALFTMEFHLAG
ncbi:sensor histidine kinase [Sideroxydans lithotrophicus]|uniref:histidine kinase n=1 Tax=Sideroxydans lithotrophicus (strain ES-1) TaxID=580332 RepID=D5CR53_SIDLE|nr:HAMP domain-containing sensor histidine kinase [Sideroxydans lithotrophicus]ADE11439.1 histidine kinase [Sideroxydans lithotrophicus ES-1]